MRNPAPLALTILLAIATLFFIFRKPKDDSSSEPAQAPSSEVGNGSWPHDNSDLSPDPDAVFGSLENGMRYIILPMPEPPERVSIRLHIAAGSLMESDSQRGLAHFLEHMVFNGSEHFKADELVPIMQRLGISFGAHVNAYTSFDETVYMLDLPDLSENTLKLGFTVMRDFADGALMEKEEIDKERGVILSEETSRDSVSYRLMQKQFDTLLPDSLLTKRFPIGDREIISTAPREEFVKFYNEYYVPERMTFVVVGDIKPAEMEERIKATFGSMENPESPGSDPDLGPITQVEGVKPHVFADKEVAATELGLLSIEPFEFKPDTRENRAAKLPLSMAHVMLGTRFDRLAKKEGSPILGGSASRYDLFNYTTLGSVDVSVADDRWQDAVAVLEQEFRRALKYGFTEAEFTEAKANLINQYEQAVKSKDTRRSDSMASGIAQSINDKRVLTDPDTNLEVVKTALEEIGPDECLKAIQNFWEGKGLHLILTTKSESEGMAEELGKLYEDSSKVEIEAPEEKAIKSFAYTDFGSPGEIAETETMEDLGITRLKLSNGVTVNFKQTDFQKNRITLSARVGWGSLNQPDGKPGITGFATAVIDQGGIGEHSEEELQQIFAGKNVSVGFSVEEDCFSISGQTTPEDLEMQLQLMTALLLHPGYRQEAVDQFRKAVPMMYQQLNHTTAGPMMRMNEWLRGNDPRFAMPEDPTTLLSYELDDIRSWIDESFTKGSIELNVIGDFDPDALNKTILATLGAVEKRDPRSQPNPEWIKVGFPEAPQTKSYSFDSKIPQGQSVVVWKAPGPKGNERTFRRLQLLGDILRNRLREEIREKLGASYSPVAGVGGSMTFDDFGYMIALSSGKPDDIEQLVEVSSKLADTLAKEGANEDELDRAKKPSLADIDKSMRENSYWLRSVMSGSTENPEKFELARDRRSDFESITLEEINKLAADNLAIDGALKVLIKPQQTEDSE